MHPLSYPDFDNAPFNSRPVAHKLLVHVTVTRSGYWA